MKKLLLNLSMLCLFALISATAVGQGLTVSSIQGTVSAKGEGTMPGATVTAIHVPTGTRYSTSTLGNGRFNLPNLAVGGPYTVSVAFVGYTTQKVENVYVNLGEPRILNLELSASASQLAEVVVTGSKDDVINSKRTGASTNISNALIKSLPTISRSADDYLRLSPSASATYNGMSFAGRNGQYNNFSLDGAVFNNPFGLDAPTPGGQTGAQPISLDVIDQIQINIAPYDVTQAGFTGAGINTVTKSGTNQTKGTAYAFYRNKSMTGKKVDGTTQDIANLSQVQTGFTLGGAIKQNKLFYFASFETEQRQDAGSNYVARTANNANNSNTSRVLESDLIAVSNILKNKFGYNTGAYQGFTHDQINYKWLYKMDWNINTVHKLAFTYNGLEAAKDKPAHPSAIGRRGPDYATLQFENSGYEMVNRLHSFSTELKSNFSGKYSNKFRAVFTTFRDKRNPFSDPFPVVNITKYGTRYIIAGTEPFSINNRLNQDALQLTNDFNVYSDKHTFTFGASYESFKFANSFNLTGYGATLFSEVDINDFITKVPSSGNTVFGAYPLDVDVAYAQKRAAADKWTWYYLTVGQVSAYAQDEWQATPDFKLTYGVRLDKPVYSDASYKSPIMNGDGSFSGNYDTGSPTIANNDNLLLFDGNGNRVYNGKAYGQLVNTEFPSAKPLISPRVGFNWNVNGNDHLQIRGGSGLFTGRFPFVWIGNHIGNPYSFFYNVTDKNFKWPQVWRSNLGTDIKTDGGTVFTADIAFTKDVNAMMVRNYKLGTPTGTLNSGTGDQRKVYKPYVANSATNDQGDTNAYVFTNTNEGYQFNLSLQAQHTFKNGLYVMAGYNYLDAKDASSISAEISSDAFDRNPILSNANQARLTPSLYGNKHRFVFAATRKFEYGQNKKNATTISLFANATSGNRYAYVYGGDINNDGTGTNDLMYVPTDAEINQMNFASLVDVNGVTQNAAAQRAALKSFIAQDSYLSGLRGKYTEKYGAETPWFSQVDVRILQDFKLNPGKSDRMIQLSLDVQNLGNLINSEWGVRKFASTNGYFQPLSVSVANGVPTYQFDPSQKQTFISSPDLLSRWQMQFGVRYIF